jgi:hypothetical protein
MIDAHAAVVGFLKNFCGAATSLSDDADIFDRFGIDGDDAFEFIDRFATKFEIDTTNYRWYFHHGEEAFLNFGAWLFKPPYRRVDRIPITPQVLTEPLRAKRWPLKYPKQTCECALGYSVQSGCLPWNRCATDRRVMATLRLMRVRKRFQGA